MTYHHLFICKPTEPSLIVQPLSISPKGGRCIWVSSVATLCYKPEHRQLLVLSQKELAILQDQVSSFYPVQYLLLALPVFPYWYSWYQNKWYLPIIIITLSPTLAHLPDAHGTENVEKDEWTICVVIPKQIAVTEALQPRDGDKWQLGHHPPIKAVSKHKTQKLNNNLTSPQETISMQC